MGDGSRVSHLERITARLLEGDISDAARLAAVEPAPPAAATGDLARLRQLLHQVESIQLPDGRLRTDAQPTEVFDAIVELVLSLGAVEEAHRRMRTFGYEGYPGGDNGRGVGLVTRRGVGRAMTINCHGRQTSRCCRWTRWTGMASGPTFAGSAWLPPTPIRWPG